MKQKITNAGLCLLCILITGLLFTNSQAALQGVRQGLSICSDSLIPSLLPFMIIANFISYSGIGTLLAKPMGKIFGRLFNIPSQLCFVVLLSFIGGYPVGTALINDLCKQNQIDKKTAQRMICFCVNAGPAMIIFAIGKCLYNSLYIGFMLWICHISSSLIIALVTGLFSKKSEQHNYILCKPKSCQKSLVMAVEKAAGSMITICAFVIFFSCIINLLPEKYRFLSVFLEVTTGCQYAATNRFSIVAISAILGFSGICVMCQVCAVGADVVNTFTLLLSSVAKSILSAFFTMIYTTLSTRSTEVISNGVETNFSLLIFSPQFTLCMLGLAITFLLFTANSKKN